MRGLEQVVAADHVADPLQGVVDHHRQVIGHAHVLARQHHVAGQVRPRLDQALLSVRSTPFLTEIEAFPAVLAQDLAGRVER